MEPFETALVNRSGGRESNQDCVGFQVHHTNGCWVVADGLGGHRGGENASGVVVESLLQTFESRPSSEPQVVAAGLAAAQSEIEARQQADARLSGMGSTAAVLLASASGVIWGHVGDSRLYRFVQGRLDFHTRDHSVTQALRDAGRIHTEQVRSDRNRNRLTRSLGKSDHRPTVLPEPQAVAPGDAFLLCSDGFWEHVQELEMEIDLAKSETPEQWLQLMEERLRGRAVGEFDNYTALAIFCHAEVGVAGAAIPPEQQGFGRSSRPSRPGPGGQETTGRDSRPTPWLWMSSVAALFLVSLGGFLLYGKVVPTLRDWWLPGVPASEVAGLATQSEEPGQNPEAATTAAGPGDVETSPAQQPAASEAPESASAEPPKEVDPPEVKQPPSPSRARKAAPPKSRSKRGAARQAGVAKKSNPAPGKQHAAPAGAAQPAPKLQPPKTETVVEKAATESETPTKASTEGAVDVDRADVEPGDSESRESPLAGDDDLSVTAVRDGVDLVDLADGGDTAEESEPQGDEAPEPSEVRRNKTDGLTYVWIPGEGEQSGFWIGKTEVPARAYQAFVHKQSISDNKRPNWGDDYPVVRVDSVLADAYCQWAGGQLPSMAQWRRAARGNKGDHAIYPWGSTPRPGCDSSKPNGVVKKRCGHEQPQEVRSHHANAYGLFHMSGNVAEWCQDLVNGSERAILGGSWKSEDEYLNILTTDSHIPGKGEKYIGFRCVLEIWPHQAVVSRGVG